jgi:Serine/threonine protein kinase
VTEKTTIKTAIVTYTSPNADQSRKLAVIATACLIVFFPLPLFYPILVPKSHGFIVMLFMWSSVLSAFFFVVAFTMWRANRNTRLILTERGIILPQSGNRTIPWESVERIAVTGTTSDAAQNSELVFTIKDRRPISFRLGLLAFEDLDKLVSSCQLWANKWTKDPTFLTLAENVTGDRSNAGDSFTALWLEEAQRRLSTTPFTPLAPGAKLQDGRVQVVQPLTAGGWSAIYLCKWQERTPAILKEAVVPPAAKEELKAKAHEQFQREATILAGLDHPQIAKVMDYFVEDGRQYMVLQRISGANLRSYIKDKGAVSEKQALKWAHELASIISYLHAKEPAVIHRDITPENLVLDMRGSIVLIDFGAANEFVGTVTGTLVGKPSYISPEQFSGRANLQSDLYSLGAVISFMVTGQDPEPLTVANPKATNADISDELQSLVVDLTQLDLKSRIKGIGEVTERLDSIIVPTSPAIQQTS